MLKTMDFSSRYNGVQIRDKFEHILDELQQDNVIKSWQYSEPIDEKCVGKKGWFKDYCSNINVTILPPDFVVKESQKKISINTVQQHEPLEAKPMVSHMAEKPTAVLTASSSLPVQDFFHFEENKR
ncbi:hypothetical protein [Peribacillus butanolivorans]|uniref:hypothetical protein n=1 Tax=Peribacillus butanolivorans TaxID=421767 RepID=UPI0036B8E3A2